MADSALTPEQLATVKEQVFKAIGFREEDGPVVQRPAGPTSASDTDAEAALDTDAFFVLFSGYLVFFMQCGFCMLCAGSVRGKNAKNIILKNLLDACFGALGWYLAGYGLAFGEDSNDFLGVSNFALHDVPPSRYHNWLFQYAFAAAATTIVSGAVAERTSFVVYLLYALFLTSWVYPIIAHWVWAPTGWLSARFVYKSSLFNGTGLLDFAGSGVVHLTGGLAGMAGAWIAGPRLGRFDASGKAREIPGHSASLALLGVFILWFGWYGFNPGSALAIVDSSEIAALAAITTTLSAAAGCITTLFISMAISYNATGSIMWDVIGAGNGVLAGLVSITASCAVVRPWAACAIGVFGGLFYTLSSSVVLHALKVDDPLDAVSIHGGCGMWGLIGAALFADERLVHMTYPTILNDDTSQARRHFGLLVGGNGQLLASAVVGIVVIVGWVLGHMVPFFLLMKKMRFMRVDPQQEAEGLDIVHHGGSAYPRELKGSSTDKLTAGSEPSFNAVQNSKVIRDIMNDVEIMKGQIHRVFANQAGPVSRDHSEHSVGWSR
ncbi:unnamed protein product [Ostreobium quekettii]|uniref:Ammonium transporter n=1 Tax=Ostreobium quekettii TaxID=121088 RepID=A0A8S1IQS7_9CHLO|nr:unnamed protein product [Ostreobium quekettii]|eukprot:evm.model.scf_680.7 EVM.evm.TU.scf_680.7   scf_680:61665-68802(+)